MVGTTKPTGLTMAATNEAPVPHSKHRLTSRNLPTGILRLCPSSESAACSNNKGTTSSLLKLTSVAAALLIASLAYLAA